MLGRNEVDAKYVELINHILNNGELRGDRTGTGTRSVFGYQMRLDIKDQFPLLTLKKVHTPSMVHELLWFLRGETNVKSLQEKGVRIWNEWSLENGDLGPVYGKQWRSWGRNGIDQIETVVAQIKTRPTSRRLIVSAWNVDDLPGEAFTPQENVGMGRMALAPCHALFQFYVSSGGLSCQLYQRSCDVFLGLPFNLASYALLTHMIAQQCGLEANELIWTGGDVHLYNNHQEAVWTLLDREPKGPCKLEIKRNPGSVFDYEAEDFEFVGYDPHPAIKAKISV